MMHSKIISRIMIMMSAGISYSINNPIDWYSPDMSTPSNTGGSVGSYYVDKIVDILLFYKT